jgi:hypothetical protein
MNRSEQIFRALTAFLLTVTIVFMAVHHMFAVAP